MRVPGWVPTPASMKTIKAAIRLQTSTLQQCFNDGLRVDPTIAGKVSYSIAISVRGEVTNVEAAAEGSLPPSVVGCTASIARGWVFSMEGAKEGADVRFSVVFENDANASPAN